MRKPSVNGRRDSAAKNTLTYSRKTRTVHVGGERVKLETPVADALEDGARKTGTSVAALIALSLGREYSIQRDFRQWMESMPALGSIKLEVEITPDFIHEILRIAQKQKTTVRNVIEFIENEYCTTDFCDYLCELANMDKPIRGLYNGGAQ